MQGSALQIPEFFAARVRGIRVRSEKNSHEVEVDIAGHIEPLTPLASRKLIKSIQEALAFAEGRR